MICEISDCIKCLVAHMQFVVAMNIFISFAFFLFVQWLRTAENIQSPYIAVTHSGLVDLRLVTNQNLSYHRSIPYSSKIFTKYEIKLVRSDSNLKYASFTLSIGCWNFRNACSRSLQRVSINHLLVF